MSGHVHFLGICGYAVSGAALLAREQGWQVSGSDDAAYPPTTDILTAAGIDWIDGSDPANLDRWGVPDLVVVGNQTRSGNPEWLAARDRGLASSSEIEFFRRLAGDRRRIAVCGTHGKTTTSSLLAHMLTVAGMDPGARLGATSLDLGVSARLGNGPFVFEGDEYTTAPWDPRPKFLHVQPHAACVTRLELDHPDVYPTLDAYRAPFVELVSTMPADGLVVLCADDPECAALAVHSSCRVLTYGTDASADVRVGDAVDTESAQRFRVTDEQGPQVVTLTMPGLHNALNATAALLLARDAGAPLDACLAACTSFRGAARRFELAGSARGVIVVDDYAHHPTEVAAALAAARSRYGARRIIAIHTPHTYSRTRALLADYAHVFDDADTVLLGPIEAARERGQEADISSHDVARRVTARPVTVVESSGDAIAHMVTTCREGDVVVVLSLGGFDKIAPRLVHALGRDADGGGVTPAPSADLDVAPGPRSAALPEWVRALPGVRFDEPMSRHSQYGIGGPADAFLKLEDVDRLPDLLARATGDGVQLTAVGAGSNALILDGGIRGLVVKLGGRRLRVEDGSVVLDAGTMMPRAALDLARLGWSGMEWGIGVPGSCGASVWGNAGAFGADVATTLLECEVCALDGRTAWRDTAWCGYAYRDSRFRRGDPSVVLRARFGVTRDDPGSVRARTDAVQAERKSSQPYGVRSLGSTFKNPPGDHAGRLIDAAGLRGRRVGGAEVSPKHANFILNTAGATAADVVRLIDLVHDEVVSRFGVDLEREVVLLGEPVPRGVAA